MVWAFNAPESRRSNMPRVFLIIVLYFVPNSHMLFLIYILGIAVHIKPMALKWMMLHALSLKYLEFGQ
jgi:hypothetical protein